MNLRPIAQASVLLLAFFLTGCNNTEPNSEQDDESLYDPRYNEGQTFTIDAKVVSLLSCDQGRCYADVLRVGWEELPHLSETWTFESPVNTGMDVFKSCRIVPHETGDESYLSKQRRLARGSTYHRCRELAERARHQ